MAQLGPCGSASPSCSARLREDQPRSAPASRLSFSNRVIVPGQIQLLRWRHRGGCAERSGGEEGGLFAAGPPEAVRVERLRDRRTVRPPASDRRPPERAELERNCPPPWRVLPQFRQRGQ